MEELIEFFKNLAEDESIINDVAETTEKLLTNSIPILTTIKSCIDKVAQNIREGNKETFDWYIQNGFTRQEALLLMINTKVSLQELSQKLDVKKSKR